jgi:hypothetical protein
MDVVRRSALGALGGTLAGAMVANAGPAMAQAPSGQRGFYPVEAFGASGDGTTDDRGAIQQAIDMAERSGGGVVQLANRIYSVWGTLRIDPTLTSLVGARATLKFTQAAFSKPGAAGLLIGAKPGSGQYGQAMQSVEGINFVGPGSQVPSTGILLQTDTAPLSTRITIRNCAIQEFTTGIENSHRTYLVQYYSLQIFNVKYGISFTSETDSGENHSLFGCTIFNTDTAIYTQKNASIFCYGCSFDYCRKFVQGSGLLHFFGCWFEKFRSQTPADVPFDLDGANVLISGGSIMTSGFEMDKGNQCDVFFMLKQKSDEIVIENCAGWNWMTKSDAMAGGAGNITVRNLAMMGRRFVPTATKNDSRHNVLGTAGEFEGKDVALDCWVEGQGARRKDRLTVQWANEGNVYAEGLIRLSSAQARSGKQSLEIAKGVGPGTQLTASFLLPLQAGDAMGLRFWWKAGGTKAGDAPLWFQVLFSRQVGEDGGVPRLGDEIFWGEMQRSLANGADWSPIAFNSYELQADGPTLCRAPAWATHVRLVVSLVSLPAGASLFIDDLGAWRM